MISVRLLRTPGGTRDHVAVEEEPFKTTLCGLENVPFRRLVKGKIFNEINFCLECRRKAIEREEAP